MVNLLPRVALVLLGVLPHPVQSLQPASSTLSQSVDSTYISRAIVKLKDSSSLDHELLALVARYSGKATSLSAQSGLVQDPALANIIFVDLSDRDRLETFINACQSLPSVAWVEKDYRLTLFSAPNDPYYTYQWNLENHGQPYYSVLRLDGTNNDFMLVEVGLPGADIKAADTDFRGTRAKTVVAIIDSGVDPVHPELTNALWKNEDELPDNGIDDDHNGFVDDIWGWDFSANPNITPISSDNNPTDPFGHGTHCAGIIAATRDNSLGIAGIARDASIMALKIWPAMSVSLAAQAVIYAADNGASVISMSWGTPFESLLLKEALQYAHDRGVVLCAATGNSGAMEQFVPARYEEVIAVGASNSHDHVTEFSTFGPHVDLVAPGDHIISLRAAGTDLYAVSPSLEPLVHVIDQIYYEASGTSMACPHVSAAAAEILSISPGLNPAQVADLLYTTCDDLLDPAGTGANLPGKDNRSGHGRLNLHRAVQTAPSTILLVDTPQDHAVATDSIVVTGTALDTEVGEYMAEFRELGDSVWFPVFRNRADAESRLLGVWNVSELNGQYELRIRIGETHTVVRQVSVINNVVSRIVFPESSKPISGPIDIRVTANAPQFESATLRFRRLATSDPWQTILQSGAPLTSANALFWDNFDVPTGSYDLNLLILSSNGRRDSTSTILQLNSSFESPRGWTVKVGAECAITPNFGDFDGDGANEIVLGTDKGIRFFALDGTEKLEGMPVFPPGNYLTPPVVCKLDDDSIEDLAAVSEVPSYLYTASSMRGLDSMYMWNSIATYRYNSTAESAYPFLMAVDLDADGRDEIILKQGQSSSGWDYMAISNPNATGNQCKYWEMGGSAVQPADLDGDGLREVYVLDGSGILQEYDRCGRILRWKALSSQGFSFVPVSMSAVDVNADGSEELVVMGHFDKGAFKSDHYVLAFDASLHIVTEPRLDIDLPAALDPSMAVFADLDGDRQMEMVVSSSDANYGYVFGWHVDGSPIIPNRLIKNLLAATQRPGITSPPLLVNLNSSPDIEVVDVATHDLFAAFPYQRICAWSADGTELPDWPQYLARHSLDIQYRACIPMFGDLNRDGTTDMVTTTASGEIRFTSLTGVPWDSTTAPCPSWRYNRKFNNIGPKLQGPTVDVDELELQPLPNTLTAQNYPNPFNAGTTIEYYLPSDGPVTIKVFNILGQLVEEISKPREKAGFHGVEWNAVNRDGNVLPSGVYFYRIDTGAATISKKMLLLK